MKNDLNIVFMGSPEFAIPSLRLLLESDFKIKGVVTATDKLVYRGRKKWIESAVKKFALEHKLPVLQPKNLKSADFHAELKYLKPDLFVVVAFRILPTKVLEIPSMGAINLHASLLPKYRGAAPIQWAIIKGETVTGLTTFLIRKEMDTGAILFQEEVEIRPHETAGELHDRMMLKGAKLILETVRALRSGKYILKEQDHTKATRAPKIFHHMCEIDFKQRGIDVVNFIRGLSPLPGAWTRLNGKITKIYRAEVKQPIGKIIPPGTWRTDNRNYLQISTEDTWIEINDLKLAGSKRMDIKSFLNGHTVETIGQ